MLILRTPDLYTSGTIVFGAIDLFSDWDVIIKIKFKTDVPECMREVVRVFKSYGHNVLRMHTDGEAVFHSDEAFDAHLLTLPLGQRSAMPDRETVRTQAISQVEWMMSGGVTFALSLLMYIFAAALLSAVASLLLHQIWGIRPFQG